MTREEARREIDSLDFYLQNHTDDYGEESHTAMMMAIKALEKEPCEDCISRQAAIDAIMGQPPEPHYPSWYAAQIEKLPSAQPEITRCKDCGHFHYDTPYVIQGVPVLGHEVCDFWGGGCKTSENGYCSFAERREDERPES